MLGRVAWPQIEVSGREEKEASFSRSWVSLWVLASLSSCQGPTTLGLKLVSWTIGELSSYVVTASATPCTCRDLVSLAGQWALCSSHHGIYTRALSHEATLTSAPSNFVPPRMSVCLRRWWSSLNAQSIATSLLLPSSVGLVAKHTFLEGVGTDRARVFIPVGASL